MSARWRFFLPGYILTIPLTLAALAYLVILGANSWRWERGYVSCVCDKLIGNPGGQCWSPIIAFASEEARDHVPLVVHELVHVVQSFIVSTVGFVIGAALLYATSGPLWLAPLTASASFAVLYGGCFLAFYATHQHDEQPGWKDDYRRNPFEGQAYTRQSQFMLGHRPGAWGS